MTRIIRPPGTLCERLCFLPQHAWRAYSLAQWNCDTCATSSPWPRWKTSRAPRCNDCTSSQPSLSRQIRDLEDEIGVQLLERTAKSVRLTDAGRAFLDEARAILKHTDDAVGKVRAIAGKARDRTAHRRLAARDRPDHARASSRLSKSDAEREGEGARLGSREEHGRSARWSLAACDHSSSAQGKLRSRSSGSNSC